MAYPEDKPQSQHSYGASSRPSYQAPSGHYPPPNSYLAPTSDASTSSRPAVGSNEAKELEEEADLLIDTYLPSRTAEAPPAYDGHAIIPFCIPQLGTNASAPFARGYNRALGISQDDLLSFIDGLNLAMTSSPPLRIVDIAGKVVGYM